MSSKTLDDEDLFAGFANLGLFTNYEKVQDVSVNEDVKFTMGTNTCDEDDFYAEVGNFYMNNEKVHDVVFIVGEEKKKIPAVKHPLINQSKVWWNMLSDDSPLKEKGVIHLPDINPEAFTLLLRHSYGGLQKLDDLSNDLVVDLCYCADKYFMKFLIAKITNRLEPKDVANVFPALHCLTCFNLEGVKNSVNQVLQTKTKEILEHPEFLECHKNSITFICKLDTISCDELTLWKAVVSWAKHQDGGSEGVKLRRCMLNLLKHIRLLTLSVTDMWSHVLPLTILNVHEIACICKGDATEAPTICNEKTVRNKSTNTCGYCKRLRQNSGCYAPNSYGQKYCSHCGHYT